MQYSTEGNAILYSRTVKKLLLKSKNLLFLLFFFALVAIARRLR